uniref:Uncharacterized protein n=1 Tax=uncultured marine virus TaxID=186617 RepID=A0A0F7L4T2_9VIRU|nr:hypothetical protein [uncultured marine virus]
MCRLRLLRPGHPGPSRSGRPSADPPVPTHSPCCPAASRRGCRQCSQTLSRLKHRRSPALTRRRCR